MGDDECTIDELAQQVGLPSSTIRLYQSKGLLPSPRRSGRVAYYDDGHLARLDLIGRLQSRGFSLAAIGQLVEGWEAGRSLDDVLGLEGSVAARLLGAPEAAVVVPLPELAERFPSIPITPEVIRRVVAMGLVTLTDDGGAVVVPTPTFLEVGSALVDLGFPLDEVLDEYEALARDLEAVAARFAGLFERNVWEPFVRDGMPDDRLGSVAATLDGLAPLAERIVQATLRHALARVAEQFLAAQASSLQPRSGSTATASQKATASDS